MKAIDYATKAGEVFVLSDSYIRIKELVDDDKASMDDIAEVIILDPALSGSILKLANSSLYNHPSKIDTVSKAVLVLGITEVYKLVLSHFTTAAFKGVHADKNFLETFWEKSVDCALLVKFLGSKLKIAKAERLFILGLLHNLGELVIQEFAPEQHKLCEVNDINELPWQKQQAVLGFSFAEVTTELLKLWQLPISLIAPIAEQDNNNFSTLCKETQLLYLAKRIMLINHHFPQAPYSTYIAPDLLEQLNIDHDFIQQAQEYCDVERFAILSVLNPSSMMIY